MDGDLVGKVAHCEQLDYTGFVVAFLDKPSYIIETDNGERYTLRCDLIREVSIGKEAEYWKSRATKAERKLEEVGRGKRKY